MRRLLVLVSLLVALVTTAPMAAFGQEATPEPGTAAATRTDIRNRFHKSSAWTSGGETADA